MAMERRERRKVDDKLGVWRRRHRGECLRADPPGTIAASVTGLVPLFTLLAMLTTPLGCRVAVLPGPGRCDLSASCRLGSVNPLGGKTTDWRAGCGRSACPVRREGGTGPLGPPYPYPKLAQATCQLKRPSSLDTVFERRSTATPQPNLSCRGGLALPNKGTASGALT